MVDPSVTTTAGESPQVLRFLRNRRMWGWPLLATRAKATGRSFSGSVASSKVIWPRCQLVDAERPAEVVQDPAAMIRQVELPDLPVEAIVDEPVREIQKEVPPHRGDDPLDAHAPRGCGRARPHGPCCRTAPGVRRPAGWCGMSCS